MIATQGDQGVLSVSNGRIIAGRYQLLDELGRGGMGVVWRARDDWIHREVAIKQLHVPAGLPVEERDVIEQRLLREVRAAGRLTVPGAITVHDVLHDDGTTFIVMELVPGAVTLADRVAGDGPMSTSEVAALAERLLSALAAAHEAGIVHRDVKPGNVLLTGAGAKLVDFGIAQAVDDPRLTATGALIGSPAYLAPERIQGSDATPASDLWALGATLLFAVEGRSPFERQSTAATLHAVLHETPRPSRDHGALGKLIAGLLVADPRARLTVDGARALLSGSAADPVRAVRPRAWLVAVPAAVLLFVAGLLLGRGARAGEEPAHVPAAVGGPSARLPTLTYGGGGDLEPFDMGEEHPCADTGLEPGAAVTSARFRSCSEPHEVEIYAAADVFGGRSGSDVSHPGDVALARFAEGLCGAHFASDAVRDPGGLRYGAVVPTRTAWEAKRVTSLDGDPSHDRGAQVSYCYVRSADGTPLMTSVTGS
ncbi:serine/threonine-protein kinase [Saccharopolyspora gregorii]|uniref:serine/threonine-protein kinase n=1 Tax=Saccharopolyspora gregorii TaxID=33914 RepID=UPI0021ABB5E9|nr:serine/threonine-protein kinase [Saccharopolyspora gregorii]